MNSYTESVIVNNVFIRNGSTTGYASKTENSTVPAAAPFILELEEIIHDSAVLSGTIDSVTAELVPWTYAPAVGEIAVNRALGLLKFNSADAGLATSFTYIPAGTLISVQKMADMSVHNHDNRYYTQSDVDTALAGKSDTSHTHAFSEITGSVADVQLPAEVPLTDEANTYTAKQSYTGGIAIGGSYSGFTLLTAGNRSVTVNTTAITSTTDQVIVSFSGDVALGTTPPYVCNVVANTSFDIRVETALGSDINILWKIVNS